MLCLFIVLSKHQKNPEITAFVRVFVHQGLNREYICMQKLWSIQFCSVHPWHIFYANRSLSMIHLLSSITGSYNRNTCGYLGYVKNIRKLTWVVSFLPETISRCSSIPVVIYCLSTRSKTGEMVYQKYGKTSNSIFLHTEKYLLNVHSILDFKLSCDSANSEAMSKKMYSNFCPMHAWNSTTVQSQIIGNTFCQLLRFIVALVFKELYASMFKGIFPSFIWYQNTWRYLNTWLKRNNLNSCMSNSSCAE